MDTRKRYTDLESELSNFKKKEHSSSHDIKYLIELCKEFNMNFSFLTNKEKRSFIQQFIESIQITEVERPQLKKQYKISNVNFF